MNLRVAIAQMTPILGGLELNLAKYKEHVENARRENWRLILFPELTLTGYSLKDVVPDVALKLDSPEIKELKRLSRNVSIVAGLVEETPDFRFYNSAVYFEAGEIMHIHRKYIFRPMVCSMNSAISPEVIESEHSSLGA